MARMDFRAPVLALFLTLAPAAWGQEQAFANRSTELKERGAADARTLTTLPEGTALKVISRGGGWTQVEAGGQRGWVRVFHLRFPVTVETAPASGSGALSGITGALGFGRQTSQSTTIATTGIRGLSPEDMKNASPDAAALAKAQSYRADKAAAERFAREGKLAAVQVEYSEGGRK
jgi:SH3 domain-containing protein